MKPSSLLCALLLGSVVACAPAAAKVFFRVDPAPMPPAEKTGIRDLVLTWPLLDLSVIAHSASRATAFGCSVDRKTSPTQPLRLIARQSQA